MCTFDSLGTVQEVRNIKLSIFFQYKFQGILYPDWKCWIPRAGKTASATSACSTDLLNKNGGPDHILACVFILNTYPVCLCLMHHFPENEHNESLRHASFHFLECFNAYGTKANLEACQMRSDVAVSTGRGFVVGWRVTSYYYQSWFRACAMWNPYMTHTHFNRPVNLPNREPV